MERRGRKEKRGNAEEGMQKSQPGMGGAMVRGDDWKGKNEKRIIGGMGGELKKRAWRM